MKIEHIRRMNNEAQWYVVDAENGVVCAVCHDVFNFHKSHCVCAYCKGFVHPECTAFYTLPAKMIAPAVCVDCWSIE